MSTSEFVKNDTYHHGNLRQALIDGALELLAEDSSFSLRALAKHVGVSPTAVYRHFSDKTALINAISARGYRLLLEEFRALPVHDDPVEQALEYGVCYVHFAQNNPQLFELMGHHDCTASEENAAIAREFFEYLASHNQRLAPDMNPEVLTRTLWSLVHGITVLGRGGVFGDMGSQGYRDHLRQSLQLLFL